MKFMLMMNSPRDGYEIHLKWPKKVLEANIAFMQDFTRKLSESGELMLTEGLASPAQAKLVRAGKNGRPITDGVFRSRRSSWRAGGSWTSTPPSARTRSRRKRRARPASAEAAFPTRSGSRCATDPHAVRRLLAALELAPEPPPGRPAPAA